MSRIVTLYSYRGGTGKTTTAVNLARLLAERGERVAVVDTALRAPALHPLFNLGDIPEWISFTDYLIGRCTLDDAVQPIPLAVPDGAPEPGLLFAVPACNRSYKVEAILTRGYDVGLLNEAFGTRILRVAVGPIAAIVTGLAVNALVIVHASVPSLALG